MAANYPDVIPMIAYEDGPKAMDWLSSAFGFKERARMLGEDGRLSHGEMEAGHGVIMLATPTPDYQAPRRHRAECEPAQRWSTVPYIVDGVLVYVDDVNAHYQRAKQRGATILSDVEADEPGKRYRAEDVEGHRWMFMERV
ncbi:MAG: hypothetical protein E6I16_08680 [Chloroflexi bacterium]|nr:MAG: hypothetical protein E6I16_08680 [Chloroflexota bacterium]